VRPSDICAEDDLGYDMVMSAVLKAYELVPEAYHQKIRNWVKGDKQTNVESVRDLANHFHRWCSAEKVDTFDSLCELIVRTV